MKLNNKNKRIYRIELNNKNRIYGRIIFSYNLKIKMKNKAQSNNNY